MSPKPYAIRILVVEDLAPNQVVVADVLEVLGFEFEIASNGEQAVQRVEIGGIDLILMDIEMPGMSGLEATAAIRALESERGAGPTPILALTASAASDDPTAFLAAGMNGLLRKPFRIDDLDRQIQRLLAPSDGSVSS